MATRITNDVKYNRYLLFLITARFESTNYQTKLQEF